MASELTTSDSQHVVICAFTARIRVTALMLGTPRRHGRRQGGEAGAGRNAIGAPTDAQLLGVAEGVVLVVLALVVLQLPLLAFAFKMDSVKNDHSGKSAC